MKHIKVEFAIFIHLSVVYFDCLFVSSTWKTNLDLRLEVYIKNNAGPNTEP